MAKSVSHAVSTRDTNISPRAKGPKDDIGWRLIQHVIWI